MAEVSRPGQHNRTKYAIWLLLALMAIYLVAIARMAWELLISGDKVWFAPIMGVALVIFPIVGVIFVIKDLQFVHRSNQLVERMAEAGELPEDDLPRKADGRIERDAADADFERWKSQVEANPDRWQNWVLLGLAYRASGDTSRARSALRRAISIESGQVETQR